MCTAALNAARRVNDFPTAVRIFEGTFRLASTPVIDGQLHAVMTAAWVSSQLTNDRQRAGIKSKVENKEQYQQYLKELEPLRKELGVELKEDLYPETKE